MDVFDQWDGDQGVTISPDISPPHGRRLRTPDPGGQAVANIFSLRRVDWTAAGTRGAASRVPPQARALRYVDVQNNVMAIATAAGSVIRWSLDGTLDPEPVQVAVRGEDISKLFLDPTGNHLVIGMSNGDYHYLHSRTTKLRKLPKWQGLMVESIAFDKVYGSEQSTKPILVGNSHGQIFETVLEASATKERSLNLVCELDQPLAIRSLEFELLNTPSDGEAKMLVLASTSNPVRLYKFLGGPTFEALFARYKELGSINFLDFGGSPQFTAADLRLFRQGVSSPAESLALLTETGTYHGKLSLSPPPTSADSVITEASLTDHISSELLIATGRQDQQLPISLAMSEFHFLVLYQRRLQAVSKLSGKQVQENIIDESLGILKGVMRDPAQGTFWLYSDKSLFQVVATDEDRHVWRLYLDKALEGDVRKFETAYKYCKDSQERAQVDAAQADYYFKSGKYELSATYYARTAASFEEVALKFVDDGQEGALRVFLLEKLAHMGEQATDKAQFKTQRVMLCTWLTEIYLKRLASLGGPGFEDAYAQTVDEFRAFLREHVEDLKIHPPTTYQLLGSHGRREEILLYASLIEDLDRVIAFHIQHGNHGMALEELKAAPIERVEQLFYKYSYHLMEAEPSRTVAVWMEKPGLQPIKLIPALVRYIQREQRPEEMAMAITYLEHCIAEKGSVEPAIYNYLLQLYAQQEDDSHLLRFLEKVTQGQDGHNMYPTPPLDLKYALRICTQHRKTRACVHVYSCMELYEEAVELALKVSVALAKEHAKLPESDEMKKRLWLMIARHLIEVEKVKVRDAMGLLEECPLLQIEDILPYFPDFVVIDDFKDKICDALLGYSETIKGLKAEMEECSQSTAEVERKIEDLQARHLLVSHNQACMVCSGPVMTQHFYIFPCRHAFHGECLFSHVVPYLNAVQRRAVSGLRERLASELSAVGAAGGANKRKMTQLDAMQMEIDGYLAAECPLCGDVMIRSVCEPLVSEAEQMKEVKEWDLT